MTTSFSALRINAGRFRTRLDTLAAIGATPDGGVHRPAFSDAHLAARRWLLDAAERAGLEPHVDGAGNHSARLWCGPPGALMLLMGSHLDSVPWGGRFDGALGVVAALEVLNVIKEQNLALRLHLEAIDFSDEEGTVANYLGSLALTGRLKAEEIQTPRGGRERFREALRRAGLDETSLYTAARAPDSLAGYLELHIEQGARLAEERVAIGIVTGIVGIRSLQVRYLGRADHAGTTPMDRRQDAAQGASAFTLAVRERAMAEFPGCVATVGNMAFEPGAFNVVPGAAVVSLEFRADQEARLDELEAALHHEAQTAARRFGLDLEIESLDRAAPTSMDRRIQQVLAEACSILGLSHLSLPSGAGHDAQCLAQVCPAGMIFVPSVGGYSHSAREFTEWQDCVNGANLLLQATLALAGHNLLQVDHEEPA